MPSFSDLLIAAESYLAGIIPLAAFILTIYILVLIQRSRLEERKLQEAHDEATGGFEELPGVIGSEAIKETGGVIKDWDEYVIVEYQGHKIRMTERDRIEVWPYMTRDQKRAQIRPVSEKDQVKTTLPDGSQVMTNRAGTTNYGKAERKKMRDALNKNQQLSGLKRRKI